MCRRERERWRALGAKLAEDVARGVSVSTSTWRLRSASGAMATAVTGGLLATGGAFAATS